MNLTAGMILAGLVFSGVVPGQKKRDVERVDPGTKQAEPSKRPVKKPVLILARRELTKAGKIARVPRAAKADERRRKWAEALAAYETITKHYSELPEIVGEAWFRHGQLLGRMGRGDDSVASFRKAVAASPTTIGGRALYEAGNVERRRKRYTAALALYRECAGGKDKKYGNRARLWLASTLDKLGRLPDARSEWKAIAYDEAVDVFVRIRSFDALAASYLNRSQLDEARAVLVDADDKLSAAAHGDSKRAQQVRRRLERMRSRKRLAPKAGDKLRRN